MFCRASPPARADRPPCRPPARQARRIPKRDTGRPRDLWPPGRGRDRTRTLASPRAAARRWPKPAGRQSRPSSGDQLVGEVTWRIDPKHVVGHPSPPVASDLLRPAGIEDLRQLGGLLMACELDEHLAVIEAHVPVAMGL